MFKMYRDDTCTEFKFIHVFTLIEKCDKWAECRTMLAKTKNGVYDPDAPSPAASEGRPAEGNKKVKAAKAAAGCRAAAVGDAELVNSPHWLPQVEG